ncbi:hypothetical protein [Neisseria sicca]|uniref:hypothetical protein n=1 Tax=Neisseria sicca TaxID=490 RepID=UPI0028809FA0|nr:hypothetical protein [Neisseria sicca]
MSQKSYEKALELTTELLKSGNSVLLGNFAHGRDRAIHLAEFVETLADRLEQIESKHLQ